MCRVGLEKSTLLSWVCCPFCSRFGEERRERFSVDCGTVKRASSVFKRAYSSSNHSANACLCTSTP